MSEEKKCQCSCQGGPKLIFPCSGAADVGAIADQAARMLMRDGDGKMFCLAGIGGRVETIIETTRQASKILAIDGCKEDCAKKTLEQAGFSCFEHMRLSDMGMEKGKTPVARERTVEAAERGRALLNK